MTPDHQARLQKAANITLHFWNAANFKTSAEAAEYGALYGLQNPVLRFWSDYVSAIESAQAVAAMFGLDETFVVVGADSKTVFEGPLSTALLIRSAHEEALRTTLLDALNAVDEVIDWDQRMHPAGDPSGIHDQLQSLSGTLRHALANTTPPPLEVRIQLTGGCLSDVHASQPGVTVAVIDWDNGEPAAATDTERLEKEIEAGLGTTWFKAY